MKSIKQVAWFASVVVSVGLFAGGAAAQSESLQSVIRPGAGDSLALSWRQGLLDGEVTQLRIDSGVAKVERCSPACQPVGRPLTLTSGQKEQILSGLRSANLVSLRSSDEAEMAADRELTLPLPARSPLRVALPRSEWPTAADGQGVAGVLDDLILKIVQASSVRPVVAVPRTIEELASVKVQLAVTANKQPGGLLSIEHGTLSITPEEGSLARQPRPKASSRLLSAAEQMQLLTALQSLDLDRLEESIPARARPAIGDDDGRLATLHLLPASPIGQPIAKVAQRGGLTSAKPAGPPATLAVQKQPRGLKRYMADWVRSPGEPALRLLSSWLLLTPTSVPVHLGTPVATPAK